MSIPEYVWSIHGSGWVRSVWVGSENFPSSMVWLDLVQCQQCLTNIQFTTQETDYSTTIIHVDKKLSYSYFLFINAI